MKQAQEGHSPAPDSTRDRAGGGEGHRQQDRSGNRSSDRQAERHADRPQERQDKGGGQKDAPQDWTRILRRLSAEIDHSPSDLEGHTTDKDKAKRLLSLRDARRRQEELRDLERSLSSKSDDRPRHQPRDGPADSKGGTPSRDHSRDSARDLGRSAAKVQHPTQSQLGPAEGDKGPQCYNCKGHGHLAKNCPKIGGNGDTARSRDSSTASRGRGGGSA
jgi:hypothetical protein